MSHWTFEPGELALPIHKILWAPTNAAHHDHLHVEGYPLVDGVLEEDCTSRWTPAIREIWNALSEEFPGWTTMGVYNCRTIAGEDTPSQHAFSNAIDIGPYHGVDEQQKFYDFLTIKEDTMTRQEILDTLGITSAELGAIVQLRAAAVAAGRKISFEAPMTQLFRYAAARDFPSSDVGGLSKAQVEALIESATINVP